MKNKIIKFTSIVFLIFFCLIQLFSVNAVHSSPVWINHPDMKYYPDHAAFIKYSTYHNRIIWNDCRTVYTCPDGFSILDFDLTSENQTHLMGVLFSNQKLTYLEICNLDTGARRLIKDMTSYHPWKIVFCDVDRDNTTEVCLGVYKQSPLHPVTVKRLFIFDFQAGLQPKWLGSRLSHPLIDFNFIPFKTQTLLVALEVGQQGQPALNAYLWDCFGFNATQAKFNGTAGDATSLNSGYILNNNNYRRVLTVMHQRNICKIINLNQGGTEP